MALRCTEGNDSLAEHTNKDVLFLSDQKAVEIVRSILAEVDQLVSVGAYRSIVYLCVSAIEGIFGDLLTLLQPTDKKVAGSWPKENGHLRRVSTLKLRERENILRDAGALPPTFEALYEPLIGFRDFVHLDAELRNRDRIELATSQAALSALNALIEKYRFVRFLSGARWTVHHGAVQVSSPEGQVHLMPSQGDDIALLVSNDRAQKWIGISFDLVIDQGSVFEFIYNFRSKDVFRAVRFDKRVGPAGGSWNSGRLVCTQWRNWTIDSRLNNEPDVNKEHHKVEIKWPRGQDLKLLVDGAEVRPADRPNWGFRRDQRIGFMSECEDCRLFNLSILTP